MIGETGTRSGSDTAPRPDEDLARARGRLEAEGRAAAHLAEEARAEAGELAHRAKDAAARQGQEMQQAAAGHLRHFAEAVRHAGDDLAEKEPGPVSDLVRGAARGLEELSETFARRSPGEMVDGLRSFGRQNPVAFIAGSMLAGFAIARFAGAGASGGSHQNGGDWAGRYGQPGGAPRATGAYGSGPSGGTYGGTGSAMGAGDGGLGRTGAGSARGTGAGSLGTSTSTTGLGRGGSSAQGIPASGTVTGGTGSAQGLSGTVITPDERTDNDR